MRTLFPFEKREERVPHQSPSKRIHSGKKASMSKTGGLSGEDGHASTQEDGSHIIMTKGIHISKKETRM
jgi:hypothetical protein